MAFLEVGIVFDDFAGSEAVFMPKIKQEIA
jgi:hypothetical protein